MEVIIISGLSGAGKSRVAAVLEDMDFYCVDNMPVAMMPKFAELCLATRGRYERVALVTDVRATRNLDELFAALDEMRALGVGHRILFVEADVETIVKRYKETRRRHPLDTTEHGQLENAVRREIALLAPVRAQADSILDTTNLTLANLQRHIFKSYMEGGDDKAISVNVKSFGYKYGLPIEADLVFDVRFLPNPYYVNDLRDKTGLDDEVYDYVFSFPQTRAFFTKLCDLLEFLLPHYIEEGKRYLVVCIGCTGGHHRSISIARALRDFLAERGYPADCVHRDSEK
ncbi:MAG: RNase adapter RapZ [Oscillospiraceae bacterium]|nr:RNase adapter RapZ [Oscillospiraceae bacterium]